MNLLKPPFKARTFGSISRTSPASFKDLCRRWVRRDGPDLQIEGRSDMQAIAMLGRHGKDVEKDMG
ncbi:uncharacterized protein N7515_006671 [Penicillium bovifimosum]|uniref:Uncharacterized protein n=1 Tax=Penicillium bovifimosum TaxID=126998 RepID=A0A9W9GV39_9EURO|nr:uncharacterized protein N7515_006671 [Penicillium bovifimosum]KAJ5130632.1 hypothetical protein N7515_006671 [Penicillium bovifimosum]